MWVRVTALVIAAAVGVCGQSLDLRETERQARALIAGGKAAEAVPLYRQVVEAAPAIAGLRVNYAVALLAAGDYEQAAEQAREAQRLQPGIAGADALLGAALFHQEKWKEALAPLERAIEQRPADRNSRGRLAQALYETGDFQGAAGVIGPAPADLEQRAILGHCLLLSARPAEALPHLEAVAGADPDNLRIQAALGRALLEANRPEEAVAHLKAALGSDEDGSIHYRLARAYRLSGQPQEARAVLEARADLLGGR